MTENQNQTPEKAESDGKLNAGSVSAGITPAETAAGQSSPEDAPQPVWKKAWGYFIWFLDYLHWEEPEPPVDDTPKTGIKKWWADFNAFLDSLDEAENAPAEPEKPLKERIRDFKARCRVPEERKTMLKTFGDICWTFFYRCTIMVFLFFVTMAGVIWAMDFFEEHHVKFYPTDRQVVKYLIDEHESIEAAAYEMTTMAGRDENVPVGQFGAEFVEKLKPVGAYSDEYGVYVITSKTWYSGEHGIFIARDNNNMPPMLSWGLIEGRIYAYTYFDD